MTTNPTVTVAQGQLQGRIVTNPAGRSFYSFQGIPYAKAPIGPLRFRDPQAPEAWQGARDATAEGNRSPHSELDYFGNRNYFGDEDCLYLNVYTPNLDPGSLPVMIFIQGDSFKFNASHTDLYGPDYLVAKDVIIVTLNYRCGVFGFLGLNTPEVPGNAGMKDIVAAIRWVKSNIKSFGGNPDNITVFGQGAGGAAVTYLTVSPLTKKLLSKAIIQSGTALNFWSSQKNPEENAAKLAKTLGCKSDDPEKILECLRNCSSIELVKGYDDTTSQDDFFSHFSSFAPVVEKDFPGVEAFIIEPFSDLERSGRVADIPIMIGTCSVEFFSEKINEDLQVFIPEELNIKKESTESLTIVEKLKQLYFKPNASESDNLDSYFSLASDRVIKVDTHKYVQYLVEFEKQPIYYYSFKYVGAFNIRHKGQSADIKQAIHMDDLGYLFRNKLQEDVVHSGRDIEMRERMLRLWTNFAKTGNPTPEKDFYLTVTWSPVTKDNLYCLNLGSELSHESNQEKDKIEFWYDLYDKDRRAKMLSEVKLTPSTNGVSENLIKGNESPQADLPKNIGVNKFVHYYESLKK